MEGIKMQCPKCQFENPEGMKFCGGCGKKLEQHCPGCNFSNPPQFAFCGNCGHDLNIPSPKITKDLSFDEKIKKIQRYLPKGLAEKILSKKDRIEGERKQVTVMFCDMEGFTPLSESLDPEEAYAIMDQIYEILIHKVHDYEGTVNEMTGDGIMALFGAPITLEDAPQRAIRSAYAIHREVSRFSEKIKAEGSIAAPIRMRVGIHTGPVVVGTLGNDLRVEFKAVGDTVNLASRMEGLADPGTTFVTEQTFKLAEGLFRFEALGKKKIKGKGEPVNIYRVIAPSTRTTRFDVSAERGLTDFVGRERELELLMDGFERSRSGKGQAFSIMAEAGVGKSRLLYEFRKAIANEDVTFLEGRCLSYSRGEAYHPVIDILKANFNIQEGDGDLEISKKVALGLKALGVDEPSNLPYLLELLSIRKNVFEKRGMTPAIRKDRINEVLRRICLRGSEIRPLIMAFEDLHWIDKSAEDSLKNLLDSISGARILLVFTYRPDYVLTWGGKSYHNQINLNRLSNRESLKMAYHLFGTRALDKNLEEFLLEKTEGVPFFTEETIRSLKDLKLIERKNGKYVLTKDTSDVTVPSTIHDVIMARVDTLPEGAKEMLRTGSAIEREFSYELISRLMEISQEELLSHLSVLKSSELIYERGIYPQSTCIFKHALTREVVYDSIMTSRKKSLHEKIGDAMVAFYKDNLDEYYAILAEQYMRSENYAKCADYSIKAGDKAVGVFAWHEAQNHYETALKNLNEENVQQRADIFKKLAVVTQSELNPDASLKYALSALKLYEKLDDKPNQLDVLMHIQTIYLGGYLDGSKEDKALEYLEKAAAIVENEPDTQEKGLIYQRTAHLYLHRGEPATTLVWSQKAVDLFTRIGVPMGTSLGTALMYTGCIDDGFIYNEKNWDPVLKAGNPLIIAVLGHELALMLALLRDVPKGREWGERILPEVAKAGDRFEGFLQRPLALIYALSGEFSKAEVACQSEKRIESKTLMSCFFEDAACVGFHYLRQGKWDQAREYLEWAIPIHKDRNNVAAIGACYFTLGSLNLEQKKYSEAEKLLLSSLDICRKGGNIIFELWVLPVLCELYLNTEQYEKASEYMQRGFELLNPDQNWHALPAQIYLAKAIQATKQRDWETATEFFDKAIRINRQYELLWDEAKTNCEWGKMYLARNQKGDSKIAFEKLSLSIDIFTKIGAQKDVDKAMAEVDRL
jgi:class 3 adenylate cyclase/tetratricopeptide (TPR) repeat protein